MMEIELKPGFNKFDFKATINYANLSALNLFKRDSISELKGLIDLDLTGNKFENIVGIANFKNIIYTNERGVYPFKQFLIFSKIKENIRQIRVDSEDIIKGELIGNFKFEEMLSLAQNALGSMYSNYTPFEVSIDQFLNFDFVIYDEVQRLKNSSSQVYMSAYGVIADKVWAMSGTPLENSVNDIVNIFNIIKS